nr:uncharacterized protein LOC115267182 [Aedes albopictus]
MNLPSFGGNILEWPSFIDLFDSAVHRNASLLDSQKLYFLKTNLIGEAAALLSHLRIEDANYAPALAKLKARYNKPLEIATQHIQRFLSQPSLTSSSSAGLRSLHDVSDEAIRALKAMNQEGRDIWLIYLLVEKLDPDSKQLWCQKRSEMKDEDVTLERLLNFIDAQSCALKAVLPNRQRKPIFVPQTNKPPSSRGPTTALVAMSNNPPATVCNFCTKSPHQLYQCVPTPAISNTEEPLTTGSPTASQTLISPLSLASDLTDTNVLLLTATINVYDKHGRPHLCRAVLDCALHSSYITEDLCNKLGLSTTEVDFEYGGIAGTSGHANRGALELPIKPINVDDWPIPGSIQLADPQFHNPGKISMLLGNRLFFQLLEPGTIQMGSNDCLPVLQNTKLGWVVSGGYQDNTNQPHSNVSSCLLIASSDPLSDQLRKFWELEEYTHTSPHLNDEETLSEMDPWLTPEFQPTSA